MTGEHDTCYILKRVFKNNTQCPQKTKLSGKFLLHKPQFEYFIVDILCKSPYDHHPVSGINSLIHSVSLASHLLIHLSAHLCHHHHSHHPSLLYSLTPGSEPTLILLRSWTAFMITGPDRTYHVSRFIFSSFFSLIFLFVPCFLLHIKHSISYHVVKREIQK